MGWQEDQEDEDTSFHCEDCGQLVDSEAERFEHEMRCKGSDD